jgi:hypothetical protein
VTSAIGQSGKSLLEKAWDRSLYKKNRRRERNTKNMNSSIVDGVYIYIRKNMGPMVLHCTGRFKSFRQYLFLS